MDLALYRKHHTGFTLTALTVASLNVIQWLFLFLLAWVEQQFGDSCYRYVLDIGDWFLLCVFHTAINIGWAVGIFHTDRLGVPSHGLLTVIIALNAVVMGVELLYGIKHTLGLAYYIAEDLPRLPLLSPRSSAWH